MTVTQIRSLLRVLIDEPHTAKWSDANLNALMFSEYRDLIGGITDRNAKYYLKSGAVSTVANNPFTALPSDCTLLNKLVNSDGETLEWLDSAQFNHTSTNAEPYKFDVTGRNIWWGDAAPDAVYSYTAYYHYIPTDLSADGDIPELPPDMHDILAYGVAVKSRLAKEDDLSGYSKIYDMKLKKLMHRVGMSQTNNPRRVKHAYYANQ